MPNGTKLSDARTEATRKTEREDTFLKFMKDKEPRLQLSGLGFKVSHIRIMRLMAFEHQGKTPRTHWPVEAVRLASAACDVREVHKRLPMTNDLSIIRLAASKMFTENERLNAIANWRNDMLAFAIEKNARPSSPRRPRLTLSDQERMLIEEFRRRQKEAQ